MLITRPIEWGPNRLTNEQPHGMNPIRLIHSKSMINTLRQRHQIPRLNVNAHPLILLVAHIKISRSAKDVTNFLGIMNVLLEEGLDLRIVFREGVGMDRDDIRVGVAAIIAKLGEFRVHCVLGIPWDGEFGIVVGSGVELPVASQG